MELFCDVFCRSAVEAAPLLGVCADLRSSASSRRLLYLSSPTIKTTKMIKKDTTFPVDFTHTYPITHSFVGLSPARPVTVRTKIVGGEDPAQGSAPCPYRYPRHPETTPMLGLPDINPRRKRQLPMKESDIRHIQTHSHLYTELCIIHAGSARHFEHEREMAVGPGTALLVPEGASHGFCDCESMHVSNVGFLTDWGLDMSSPEGEADFVRQLVLHPAAEHDETRGVQAAQLTSEELDSAISCVELMGRELVRERPSHAWLRSSLQMLLLIFARADMRNSGAYSEVPVRPDVWQAIETIERAVVQGEALSISELAADMGFSGSHLSKLFKRHTGRSPEDYYQHRRVQYACQLLFNPGYSITDIAFQLGYASSSHLSRLFRKYTDLTPREFRRRYVEGGRDGENPPEDVLSVIRGMNHRKEEPAPSDSAEEA
jgi:AraC-like DNA-binding protein